MVRVSLQLQESHTTHNLSKVYRNAIKPPGVAGSKSRLSRFRRIRPIRRSACRFTRTRLRGSREVADKEVETCSLQMKSN